jgi:hypothetical protein
MCATALCAAVLLGVGCAAPAPVPATSAAPTPTAGAAVSATAAATAAATATSPILRTELTDVRSGSRFTLGGFAGKTVLVLGMAVW